jgi:hypothetical protein
MDPLKFLHQDLQYLNLRLQQQVLYSIVHSFGWLLLDQRMLHWLNKKKKKPLVPLLATDLEGMLDKTVMDKLLMVAVHKPDQLDLLQAPVNY